MNKREFMEQAWLHITRRLPPDSPGEIVLVYNSKTGYMVTLPADWAHDYAELMLDSEVTNKDECLSWDRQFNYWMPLYPPEGRQTWAEYQEKATPKKRGRRS